MAVSLPSVAGVRWQPGARFLLRIGRRTLVESLYLLTAPVTAAIGLLLVLGGLGVGMLGLLLPGGSPVVAGGRALARWPADVERWRIAKVRSQPDGTGRRQRPKESGSASDPGRWLDAAHAVTVLPVVMVTSVVTAMWWWVAVACTTFTLRNGYSNGSSLWPQTLYAGSARSHIIVSLWLASPQEKAILGTVVGFLLLFTLPLVTRACVAAQAGLGQTLLSDLSALYRRISGLEQERDTARAQTVAAVTAEASALRRLERDIHDGPQQRLVRLAMELGRAQRHLESRPEAAGRRSLTRSSRLRKRWRSYVPCRVASPRPSSPTAACGRRSLPWPRVRWYPSSSMPLP
ncbi:MAG: sensor domain-containing protein [Streptosporangiaceae bacterium]